MEFYITSIMCKGKMGGEIEKGQMWHAKELRLVLQSCNNPLNDLKMYALFMLKGNTFAN